MKIAFLFSGQGSQKVGMGQDLYNNYNESKEIFNRANNILDWDIKELCFKDPNNLINQTRYTQPALFTTTVAALEVAKSKGIKPSIVAGFSLGEYVALYESGALDFETALKLVEKRAIYMDEVAKQTKGSMAAIIGLSIEKIEKLCKEIEEGLVEVANDNCKGQVVVSGDDKAVKAFCKLACDYGAKRAIPLNVSGAFHSSLLEEAANKIQKELDLIEIKEPSIEIVSNVTATTIGQEEIIENIPIQIKSRVRFRESIEYLIDENVDVFIEIGVGKTLCSFVKKTKRDSITCNIDSNETLNSTIKMLEGGI